MASLFWAALAGAALLGSALVVNLLFGRDLLRTRTNLFAVKRLSESTRRFNDAAIDKARESQPAPLPLPSPPAGTVRIRRPARPGK